LKSNTYKHYLNKEHDILEIIKNNTTDKNLLEHIRTINEVMKIYKELSEYNLKDDIDNSRTIYRNNIISMVKDYNDKYQEDIIL